MKLDTASGGRSQLYEYTWELQSYTELIKEFVDSVSDLQFMKKYVVCKIDGYHILTLDCDSEEAMTGACLYLDEILKMPYEIVESSDKHYWIFVDYSSKDHRDVTAYLSLIPCVDRKYTDVCVKSKSLTLRITPRGNKHTKRKPSPDTICYPEFNANHCLTGKPKKFYEWMAANFKMFENLIRNKYKIEYAFAMGKLADELSDPEFISDKQNKPASAPSSFNKDESYI